jgi:hypothetical protein
MMYNNVDDIQAAFIQERYIHGNVLAAHEIIYFVKINKQKGTILKVNFEKPYDRVHWPFLKELLLNRGFDIILD